MIGRWPKALLVIMALTCAMSLAYSFYFRAKPLVDAKAYDRIAWNIAQGNGYRESLDTPIDQDYSIMRVGPGYQYFVAGIYSLFGRSYPAVWIAHALLLAVAAALAFWLAQAVLPSHEHKIAIGLIAAALIGFSPDLITMSGLIMSEILGIVLILCAVLLLFKYWYHPLQPAWLLGATGAMIGLAAAVRTPALFLLLPLLWLLFRKKNWWSIIMVLISVAIIFLPWVVRNWRVYHAFIPTNLAYSIDLWSGNHPGANGELEPFPENDRYIARYGYLEGSRQIAHQAVSFILHNPMEFFTITARRVSIYFSLARPTGFWFHLSGISKIATLALSELYAILLFGLGFYGIVRWHVPADRDRLRLLLALGLMMPLAIIGIIVETRYRFLAYPFLAVFAAYACMEIKNHNLSKTAFWSVAGVLAANTLIDVVHNLQRILDVFHV